MLEMAKSELAISPEDLDRDPWLFNVRNGTIELQTGELRDHRKEDFITKLAPLPSTATRIALCGGPS